MVGSKCSTFSQDDRGCHLILTCPWTLMVEAKEGLWELFLFRIELFRIIFSLILAKIIRSHYGSSSSLVFHTYLFTSIFFTNSYTTHNRSSKLSILSPPLEPPHDDSGDPLPLDVTPSTWVIAHFATMSPMRSQTLKSTTLSSPMKITNTSKPHKFSPNSLVVDLSQIIK